MTIEKKHTAIAQRTKVGLRFWEGAQSGGVIDLSCGDTHGSSAPHACMILMGGPAAGYLHLWEMNPAVRPSHWADCGCWLWTPPRTDHIFTPLGVVYVGLIKRAQSLQLCGHEFPYHFCLHYTFCNLAKLNKKESKPPTTPDWNQLLCDIKKTPSFVCWFHEPSLRHWPSRIIHQS